MRMVSKTLGRLSGARTEVTASADDDSAPRDLSRCQCDRTPAGRHHRCRSCGDARLLGQPFERARKGRAEPTVTGTSAGRNQCTFPRNTPGRRCPELRRHRREQRRASWCREREHGHRHGGRAFRNAGARPPRCRPWRCVDTHSGGSRWAGGPRCISPCAREGILQCRSIGAVGEWRDGCRATDRGHR